MVSSHASGLSLEPPSIRSHPVIVVFPCCSLDSKPHVLVAAPCARVLVHEAGVRAAWRKCNGGETVEKL